MTSRGQPLEVEVRDGRLIISVGVQTLKVAADGRDTPWKVSDTDEAAEEIATELKREDPDSGLTVVMRMLDAASDRAAENGGIGFTKWVH